MHKRGQITIYVIVGIILIGGIFLLFSLNDSPEDIDTVSHAQYTGLIEGCMKMGMTRTLDMIGMYLPEIGPLQTVPTDEEYALMIENHLDYYLPYCLETLPVKTKTEVIFSPSGIIIETDIIGERGTDIQEKEFGMYSIEYGNYDVRHIFELSRLLIDTYDEGICVSCTVPYASDNNLVVDIVSVTDTEIVATIIHPTLLDGEEYRFTFNNEI